MLTVAQDQKPVDDLKSFFFSKLINGQVTIVTEHPLQMKFCLRFSSTTTDPQEPTLG